MKPKCLNWPPWCLAAVKVINHSHSPLSYRVTKVNTPVKNTLTWYWCLALIWSVITFNFISKGDSVTYDTSLGCFFFLLGDFTVSKGQEKNCVSCGFSILFLSIAHTLLITLLFSLWLFLSCSDSLRLPRHPHLWPSHDRLSETAMLMVFTKWTLKIKLQLHFTHPTHIIIVMHNPEVVS